MLLTVGLEKKKTKDKGGRVMNDILQSYLLEVHESDNYKIGTTNIKTLEQILTRSLIPSSAFSSTIIGFISSPFLNAHVTWYAVLQVLTEHWIQAPLFSLHITQMRDHRLCYNFPKTLGKKSNDRLTTSFLEFCHGLLTGIAEILVMGSIFSTDPMLTSGIQIAHAT